MTAEHCVKDSTAANSDANSSRSRPPTPPVGAGDGSNAQLSLVKSRQAIGIRRSRRHGRALAAPSVSQSPQSELAPVSSATSCPPSIVEPR